MNHVKTTVALIIIAGFAPMLGTILHHEGVKNAPMVAWAFSMILIVYAFLTFWNRNRAS